MQENLQKRAQLEKSNYFLESILDTLDEPANGLQGWRERAGQHP